MEQLKLKYNNDVFMVEWFTMSPFNHKILKIYKVEKRNFFSKRKFVLIHKVRVSNSFFKENSENLVCYKNILDEIYKPKVVSFFNTGKTINLNNI